MHLHARYGAHFHTRVPRFGRDLAYAPETADLLIAASSSEIYRCLTGKNTFCILAGARGMPHACPWPLL